jgi:integrase
MAAVDLTDAGVKALKCQPGQCIIEVRDADVHGLEIRVTPRGIKTWRLHYTRRSDGRRRAIKLGRYPGMSLKKARARAKALQSSIEDLEARKDPAADLQARRTAHTFKELADDWIERHAMPNRCARAVSDDRSMLAMHVLPEIGLMKIGEIAKRDIIRLLDKVAAKPDARIKRKRGSSRKLTHRPNRVFELVRAIFRWAVARDMIIVNPTAGLQRPIKRERPRERELSNEEIRALWVALQRAPRGRESWKRQPDDFPMRRGTALTMLLALVTGQRIGEVAGIAIGELDLESAAPAWKIPGARTKNGEMHLVPLSRLAVRLIMEARSLADGSMWLFPNPSDDGPVNPHAATRALERARPRIGLDNFRVHDLRRTAATKMEELGTPPHVISHILNHISVSRSSITKRVYARYKYEREKREALDAWGTRIEEIVSENTAVQNTSPDPTCVVPPFNRGAAAARAIP